ncbi:uncharacterized protein LOC135106207 [Scylla paramamosain]|uniref:uncharacterized protein LOC135106207 n=1 Tax=Scylla paramamosain TaxID=85552 RepID=UPI00308276DA
MEQELQGQEDTSRCTEDHPTQLHARSPPGTCSHVLLGRMNIDNTSSSSAPTTHRKHPRVPDTGSGVETMRQWPDDKTGNPTSCNPSSSTETTPATAAIEKEKEAFGLQTPRQKKTNLTETTPTDSTQTITRPHKNLPTHNTRETGRLLQWNVNGLQRKQHLLTANARTECRDIILLEETLLPENDTTSIRGYKAYQTEAEVEDARSCPASVGFDISEIRASCATTHAYIGGDFNAYHETLGSRIRSRNDHHIADVMANLPEAKLLNTTSARKNRGCAQRRCLEEAPTDTPFTPQETWSTLKPGRDAAAGADKITYTLIREAGEPAYEELLRVINASYDAGKLPTSWKQANIVPIPKPNDPGSHRPISLLCCLRRTAEMMMSRLQWAVGAPHQQFYAFTPDKGTRDCLTEMLTTISDRKTTVTFIDLEKAFELASAPAILEFLVNCDIRGKLLKWTEDFLRKR